VEDPVEGIHQIVPGEAEAVNRHVATRYPCRLTNSKREHVRHSISQRGGARFLPSSQRRKWPTGAFGLTPIRPVGPRRGFVRQNPLGAKRRRRGGKARTSASTTLAGFVNPAIPGLRLGLEVPHHPESVVVVLVVGRVPVAVRGTLFLHELVRMPMALEGQGLQVHGHAHQETAHIRLQIRFFERPALLLAVLGPQHQRQDCVCNRCSIDVPSE